MNDARAVDAIVSGARGFLGSALVHHLRQQGRNVVGFARADGDVAALATWRTLPAARTLFHLAGRSYVPDSWTQPDEFIRGNVLGTQCALDYCRSHGATMVYASAYVYGIPTQLPISEQHTPYPNNPYALSKFMAEELCEFAAKHHAISTTVLRIFNVYGPGQRPEFLIPTILKCVADKQPIRVLDLAPRRDYVYLNDVVDALARAAQPSLGFRRINIGSGTSYSIQEIIDVIQSEAGTSLPLVSTKQERTQEIPDVVAEIRLAREQLGWVPLTSFRDGIRQIISEQKKIRV
jgi:GDP-4-dehydro-6-deoxy-D-mannose reductase